MKKLFEKIKVFLVDRFTARHCDKFEVSNKIMTPANVVTMIGIISTWVFALQVTFNVCPVLIPVVALIPFLSDTVDGKLADMYGHSKWGKIIDISRDYNYTAGFLWAIWIIGGNLLLWSLVLIIGSELIIACWILLLSPNGNMRSTHCFSKIRFATQWFLGFLVIVQWYWVDAFIFPVVWIVWTMVLVGVISMLYIWNYGEKHIT